MKFQLNCNYTHIWYLKLLKNTVRAYILLWLIGDGAYVWAQVDESQRQIELLQRQDEERARRSLKEVQKRLPQKDGLDTKALVPRFSAGNTNEKCIDISDIELHGANAFDTKALQALLRKYINYCLNSSDIEAVLSDITKFYINNGFITTRAYLPSQDLTTGILNVVLIEGRIGKIEIKDGAKNSVSLKNVFPAGEGERLNLRDLEQGLEQINRLASNNARFEILPGEEVGESLIVIHNQPKFPLSLQASLDNQGSDSTGKNQAGVFFTAENLLNFNESISFNRKQSVFVNENRKNAVVNGFGLDIPFGYKNLSFSTSRSNYISPVSFASGLEILARGHSQNNSLRLNTVLHREQFTRFSFSGSVSTKETENYLNDQFLSVSSRKLSTLDLEGALQTRILWGQAVFRVGYVKGLRILGALKDTPSLPRTFPHAQFNKYRYSVEYTLPFQFLDNNFSFKTRLAGQKSNISLYGSEKFSVGGINSIRGFPGSVLSGDNGYYLRSELSLQKVFPLGKNDKVFARFYAGYDTGAVYDMVSGTQNGSLTSIAIGAYLSWRGITLSVLHARPLTLPSTLTREFSQTWATIYFSY